MTNTAEDDGGHRRSPGRLALGRVPALGGVLLAAALLAGCAPALQPMGDRVVQPTVAADSFRTADGLSLPLRAWLPPQGSPRAVILALHGFNDYANTFTEAGAFWADAGIATYAYDQRGFGATAPEKRGIWPGAATMRADLFDAARAVAERHPGVPLYLLGHSMGGAVVLTAVVAHGLPPGVDGAILVAPAVWSRETMPLYQRVALAIGSWTVPWMAMTAPEGIRRYASDNIEMLRAMGRDPLVIKETRIDAIWGLTNLMDEAMDAATRLSPRRLGGPVLLLYGDKEDILPAAPVNQALAALPAGADGPRVAIYPQGWHMLLRDLQAQTVWRDVLAWIDDPAAPLPSGADRRDRRIPVRNGRPDLPPESLPRAAGPG